jgi:maleylpyruvate isomerase
MELLQEASQRLVRTVDGFTDDDWHVATDLPGWTRAHVVAHLALNAEGLGGALEGVYGEDGSVPMYASQEARDGDIEELAQAVPSELRARLLAGVTRFADAVVGMPDDQWETTIERTPGKRAFRAASAIGMRWREVEIHHADLGAGYSRADWPDEFCRMLLDGMAKRGGWMSPFRARATDLDDEWELGDGSGPTVSGAAADLGWWLTGRGAGEGLTSDGSELPRIEEW